MIGLRAMGCDKMKNTTIRDLIQKELQRQNQGIELIASENYVSKDVREAAGSILTDKYAEGYPGRRYYGGCEVVDLVEQYAIDQACALFKVKYANVQPHSGSQANAAAYKALMPNGGKVLALGLNEGGHLTHGSPVSFSSHLYNFVFYSLDARGEVDYSALLAQAKLEKPDVILAGFSAYPYAVCWSKLRYIAKQVGAYFMVDMAHVAGLVAAGKYVYGNPCDYADIVTSTTQKTLRGPRGGLILTNSEDLIKKVNSAVFPYYQGGPLMHTIAAKGICFEEASKPEFAKYIEQVIHNTKICRDTLDSLGAEVSETETHLFLLDTLDSYGLTGLDAQKMLEEVGITTNKNMLSGDTRKPSETSGLRIGFAAATTRGCTSNQAKLIAQLIDKVLSKQITSEEATTLRSEIISTWKDISEIES